MINVAEVCKHIQSYIEIYEFIQDDEKTISEVKSHLMEACGKPESTARSHVEAMKKSNAGLLQIHEDKIGLDVDKVMEFEVALNDIFHWEEYDDRSRKLKDYKKALNKANKSITELDELNIQVMTDHMEEIEKLEQKEKSDRLQNQALENDVIKAKSEQAVVDTASVRIKASWTSSGRKLFSMKEVYPSLDPETCALFSYFQKMKMENKLTAMKLRSAIFSRVFSDKVLGKVVEHITPLRKLRNSIWPNRDVLTIEELLSYDGLTNSEKLALYAFFSKRHSKEVKEILEEAAKNGINAEFVIHILETYFVSRKTKEAFLEALKLAETDSEYLFRMKFAEELVKQQWSIEAKYNGQMTRFQLVPVNELYNLQRDVNNLECRVKYQMDKTFSPVDQKMEE